MQKWRCILSGIGDPYDNMATDEALLDSACCSGTPVLRIYGWSPATVSIGFSQRAAETLNFEELYRKHLMWVRRPTGGRAVLHDMEVTYSVSVPASHDLYAIGLEASYERLCQPVIAALNALKVPASLAPHGSSGFVSASCFTAPGTTDVLVHHRKIVGSAQMRTHSGFLQHGSIILKGDLNKLFAVVRTHGLDPDRAAEHASHLTTSIQQETGRTITFSEMAAALVNAFADDEDITLQQDVLTKDEWQKASFIRQKKYASKEWNTLR